MQFDPPLSEARLIRRYKRFMADVVLPDGSEITLHCPNTGSMKHCQPEGARVWYSDSGNPKRKYPCTWELVEVPVTQKGETGYAVAGINTGRANALVREAIEQDIIPSLNGYDSIRQEVKYGDENSRIDLLLSGEGQPDCYVEVKNVTLAMGDGLGLFPDAVTSRGTKHLRELMRVVESGERAMLVFCVQHTGIQFVSPADEIDPLYGQVLREAIEVGVEVVACGGTLSAEKIALDRCLDVRV